MTHNSALPWLCRSATTFPPEMLPHLSLFHSATSCAYNSFWFYNALDCHRSLKSVPSKVVSKCNYYYKHFKDVWQSSLCKHIRQWLDAGPRDKTQQQGNAVITFVETAKDEITYTSHTTRYFDIYVHCRNDLSILTTRFIISTVFISWCESL